MSFCLFVVGQGTGECRRILDAVPYIPLFPRRSSATKDFLDYTEGYYRFKYKLKYYQYCSFTERQTGNDQAVAMTGWAKHVDGFNISKRKTSDRCVFS